jgi:hypothetical protein
VSRRPIQFKRYDKTEAADQHQDRRSDRGHSKSASRCSLIATGHEQTRGLRICRLPPRCAGRDTALAPAMLRLRFLVGVGLRTLLGVRADKRPIRAASANGRDESIPIPEDPRTDYPIGGAIHLMEPDPRLHPVTLRPSAGTGRAWHPNDVSSMTVDAAETTRASRLCKAHTLTGVRRGTLERLHRQRRSCHVHLSTAILTRAGNC